MIPFMWQNYRNGEETSGCQGFETRWGGKGAAGEVDVVIIKGQHQGSCGDGTLLCLSCRWWTGPAHVVKLQKTKHTLLTLPSPHTTTNKMGET